jgi:23S rRNA (cytidine1920-2'-O)/16S rRNA (cytidine1409-2'-O)-methyltransferase
MKAAAKQRLDQLLVDRGLAESREKAKALILAGEVLLSGQKAAKPGQDVPPDSALELIHKLPYVSRGGLKLEGALRAFEIDPTGKVCLDVGASTGGFTDCLLQHGALRVYAFDVGSGQLDWKLRNDPRVIVRERVNARYLQPSDVGEPIHLAVCDVSFISVTMIVPHIVPLLAAGGEMVILIKPQFEVGKGRVGKGGIVREPELHKECCQRVEQAVCQLGFRTAIVESPIQGAEGNREFLLHAAH